MENTNCTNSNYRINNNNNNNNNIHNHNILQQQQQQNTTLNILIKKAIQESTTATATHPTSDSTICDNINLSYSIHRYSSYSTSYIPENILVDRPNDQSSRWSAFSNNPPQYLTLRLRRPAIVNSIKFGKFEKSHVCNLKKFRIFGGLDEDHLELLLEAGLKNDNVPETFNLRSKTTDCSSDFPVLYLKIEPLLSWGPTFNFSIWYIELSGQDDPMLTASSMTDFNDVREAKIVKLCLKHFRQQGYVDAFRALQLQTNIELEHPLLTQLHNILVEEGDFKRTEEFMETCIEEGLIDHFIEAHGYQHRWTIQHSNSPLQPPNRGGHQLVLDSIKRCIYLFGGWDGSKDLGDFWVFDLNNPAWVKLYDESHLHNGPTPRSCHKMIFDPISHNIFMLGRYLDNSIRTQDYIKSDFYLYDTRNRCWMLICEDTSIEGGPHLIYDHQMCIDTVGRTIYVFGGKVLTPRSVTASALSETEYSGLFAYHIDNNTWTHLLVDCHHPSASHADVQSIKSCISHCMLFHTKNRKLYIYGGQRGKDDIVDFLTYDVVNNRVEVLNNDNGGGVLMSTVSSSFDHQQREPPFGFTLRASIDCDREEIYVFSTMRKIKERLLQPEDACNSFWVYSIPNHTWSQVYSCRPYLRNNYHDHNSIVETNNRPEPCPRYAHQLIYDEVSKMHYLFGGNPGHLDLPDQRLGDFWTLILEKPKREQVLKQCRYLIRKLCYIEMAAKDRVKAMQFLRNELLAVTDHENTKQLQDFHKLAALVFQIPEPNKAVETKGNKEFKAHNSLDSDEEEVDENNADNNNNTNSMKTTRSESFELSVKLRKLIAPTFKTHNANANANERRVDSSQMHDSSKEKHKRRLQRSFLFNRFSQLFESFLVHPVDNLSDFV